MERVEITVRGRVQGVAFRWYTQKQALSLGLTGWVRNRPDGSVQMVAEGSRRDLEIFCNWAKRGPDHARVDHQEVFWSEAAGKFDDFLISG
ncbi:MAG: acylphosphatase [Candidatus Krumholzibacteriota bacterium]